jgi:putative transposase
MYDYRRMTPEQRRQVVEARQAHGFPFHKPPHPDLGSGWYIITGATYEHRQLFSRSDELTALQRRLFEAINAADISCAAWVVMPNHYHLLLNIKQMSVVGKALGPVHGRSGHYANHRDEQPGRQVWYKYSDRKIRSERHYWTCLHYIIMNPVKHGFAREMFDWSWSCVHELLAKHGRGWIDDLQEEYPLREFGRGWDE